MTRRAGRIAAALAALAAFGWAGWAAYDGAMPELRVYDGYWIMLGSSLAVLLVGPLVWRWPRDRSLGVIALVSLIGGLVPLCISAIRHHIPIVARLRGSWRLAGADLVVPALVVGFVCLWFVLREWVPKQAESPRAVRRRKKK
jgi:hypothetical protein